MNKMYSVSSVRSNLMYTVMYTINHFLIVYIVSVS